MDRNAGTHFGNPGEVDVGETEPRRTVHLQRHLAPRVGHQRMTVSVPPILMPLIWARNASRLRRPTPTLPVWRAICVAWAARFSLRG